MRNGKQTWQEPQFLWFFVCQIEELPKAVLGGMDIATRLRIGIFWELLPKLTAPTGAPLEHDDISACFLGKTNVGRAR